jgi:hypothetical protein
MSKDKVGYEYVDCDNFKKTSYLSYGKKYNLGQVVEIAKKKEARRIAQEGLGRRIL